MTHSADIVVIGAGIVGLATAYTIARELDATVIVAEAEDQPARHQTGHNSGVIHSGLYYKPGSLKATNCTTGRSRLLDFCAEHAIPHEVCGKVVVATSVAELPALDRLEERGRANGLDGMRRIGPEELRDYEPACVGIAALHVPQTGIINFSVVAAKLAALIEANGGTVLTGFRVSAIRQQPDALVVRAADGRECVARHLINCAGLQSDRIARMAGLDPGVQIVPFRGEYYKLIPARHQLIRNLIYPVPDPRFPFLGVHFTRMVEGGVEAGPNAVLAFRREGYRHRDVSLNDLRAMAGYRGFWRMAARHWRTGIGEFHRSLSKAAFVKALQRLVPSVQAEDLEPGGAGVRAQAVAPDGSLVDDFRIVEASRMIHVLNAPSPAATSCLSIGKTIADLAANNFSLRRRA